VRTTRQRKLELELEGSGHELRLGGGAVLRLHHPEVRLRETVLGVCRSHEGRRGDDVLTYGKPISTEYATEAAIVHLPAAPPAALHGLEQLVRVALPAFVRHEEEDLDVAAVPGVAGPLLAIVDRHPGGIGFARAIGSDVLGHALWWSREILHDCGSSEECKRQDGCGRCVHGAPRLAPADGVLASRSATLALLDGILGG
jgi:hypothetical protein